MDYIVIDNEGKPHNFLNCRDEHHVLDIIFEQAAAKNPVLYNIEDIQPIDRESFNNGDLLPEIKDKKFKGWRERTQKEKGLLKDNIQKEKDLKQTEEDSKLKEQLKRLGVKLDVSS